MKNRKSTWLLTVLLVAALCLSLLPAIALAAGETTATLVESVADLKVGDQIVIVNADGTKALGPRSSNNTNFKCTSVTSEGKKITLADGVVIITLEEKTDPDKYQFTFRIGEDQYLYASSSTSNHLKVNTKANVGDNGKWNVTISSNGVATIKAAGSNTRNWMRYNSGSSLFSCYASGQGDIKIYKLDTASTETSEDTTTASGGETPVDPTPTNVSIEEALGKSEDTTIPGAVTGIVTLIDGYNVYIQDEDATHGIDIYIAKETISKPEGLAVGKKVTITNTVRADFSGLPELKTTKDSVFTVGEMTTLKYNAVTSVKDIENVPVCTAIKYTGKLTVAANGTNWGPADKPWATPSLKVTDGTNDILIYKAYGDLTQSTSYDGYTTESFVGAVGTNGGNLQLRNDADHKIVLAAPEGGDKPTPAPETVTIEDALAKTKGDAIPDAITGYVTLIDGYTVYIQDANAEHGIALYFAKNTISKPELKVGQKITVTNTKRADYNGLPELETTAGSVLTLGEETTLKYNEVTSIADITDAMICTAIKYTGKLTVTDTDWGEDNKYSTPNLTVTDGTNTAVLYKADGDFTKPESYNGYTTNSVTGALGVSVKEGEKTWRIFNTVKLSMTAPATNPENPTNPTTPEPTTPEPTTPPTADGKTAGLAFSVKEGDKVYIYYADGKLVLTGTAKGKKLDGVAGTITDGKLAVTDGMLELTVSVNDKGQYTFKTADGKFLTAGETGNELKLADAASDCSLWTLEPTGSYVKIKNVGAKYNDKAQYLEFYSGFTTYGYQDKSANAYNFQLYVLNAEAEKPVTPSTGDNSMAIVGVVLMVLAVSGVAVLVVGRKKWMR